MSPEQARGESADFRADQFALGVMLYEMVTTVHPFKRDTPVQTLSAIIGDEPADPQESAAGSVLPTPVWWLIRRLLAKAPRDRYAHTADLVTDLRNLRTYRHEPPRRPFTGFASGRWRAALVAAALVAGGLVVGSAIARPDAPVSFTRYTPLATDAGYQGMVAWSPDGRQIAYEAEANGVTQIFTRTLGAAQRVQVTHVPAGAYDPIWSSDGYIYFHSQARDQDALWRITPVGGEAELVAEGAARSTISRDGRTLFFLKTESMTANSTLWVASPPTAQGRRYTEGALAELTGAGGLVRFSPDGTKVLLWLGPGKSEGAFWLIPAAGGEPRALPLPLGDAGQAPPYFTWLADNRHFVVARSDGPSPGTHLWVADTAGTSMHPLTLTPGNETAPSAAPDGRTIAFSSTSTDFDLVEVPLDGSALKPFLSSTRDEYDPTVSPTSTQFAFVTNRTGRPQIWLQNEEGYLQQPLDTESAFEGAASVAMGALAFSPDGRRLAFQRAGPNVPRAAATGCGSCPSPAARWYRWVAKARTSRMPRPGRRPASGWPTSLGSRRAVASQPGT